MSNADGPALLPRGSEPGGSNGSRPDGSRASEPGELRGSEPGEPPASQQRQTRCYVRAFVATNYLLGKRAAALGEGLHLTDAAARQALVEVTEQLSHGVQAQRARVLAAEVGRLMRSLSTQKLK
jgi:hypothetical protein